jgi:REP-associated tyrosine transposase
MNDSPRRRRQSIRLKGYDYAQPGAYFVTIVSQGRACLFGKIVTGEMRLNDAGEDIKRRWLLLGQKFPTIDIDTFVIMPNHIHGIVNINNVSVGADLRVGPPNARTGAHTGAPLPKIVQWFKTMTTNTYIRGAKTLGWPPFQRHLWQRGYYEHVIRGEISLNQIRQYIIDNPARWEFDRENPDTSSVNSTGWAHT